MRTCGVLALQGDWGAHRSVLESLGVRGIPIRSAAELSTVDGLVLPGGESTAMLKLLGSGDLAGELQARIADGLPVLATCAGIILLAAEVEPAQFSFGLLDIDVQRNAYGRQSHSAIADIDLGGGLGPPNTTEAVFIRAPRMVRVGAAVEVLGRWREDPVLIRQGRIVGATYHPELSADRRVHELFLRTEETHEQAAAAAH